MSEPDAFTATDSTTDDAALNEQVRQALWGTVKVYDAREGHGTEVFVHAPVHAVVAAVLSVVRTREAEAGTRSRGSATLAPSVESPTPDDPRPPVPSHEVIGDIEIIDPEDEDVIEQIALAICNADDTNGDNWVEDRDWYIEQARAAFPFIRAARAKALRDAADDFESTFGIPEFARQSARDGVPWAGIEQAWEEQGPYMSWLRNRADKAEAGTL